MSYLCSSRNYCWNVNNVLGKGATGAVYSGVNKYTGDPVAVKSFNHASHMRPYEVQESQFEVLKKDNHQNIVRLIAIEEENESHHKVLIMELCTFKSSNSQATHRNAQYSRAQYAQSVRKEQTRSMDSSLYQYHDRSIVMNQRQGHPQGGDLNQGGVLRSDVAISAGQLMGQGGKRVTQVNNYTPTSQDIKSRSKSSDDVRRTVATGTDDLQLDANTLKKMLNPLPNQENGHLTNHQHHHQQQIKMSTTGVNTVTTSTSTPSVRREILRSIQRPTSVPSWSYSDDDGIRIHRRETFRLTFFASL